jgi:hypothetical protein
MAMRLISSRSWRWSFTWIFQCSLPSAFRSCVARHLCLQNLSRPSIKYMFFVGDVAVHLRLGLAINKIYTKIKRTLGFSETLDWFFCFADDQNQKMQKEKSREKLKIFTNANYIESWLLVPRQQCQKKGLVDGWLLYQSSFGLASRQVLRRSQGTLLPSSVNPRYQICGTMCNARSNLISGKHFDLEKGFCI